MWGDRAGFEVGSRMLPGPQIAQGGRKLEALPGPPQYSQHPLCSQAHIVQDNQVPLTTAQLPGLRSRFASIAYDQCVSHNCVHQSPARGAYNKYVIIRS